MTHSPDDGALDAQSIEPCAEGAVDEVVEVPASKKVADDGGATSIPRLEEVG